MSIFYLTYTKGFIMKKSYVLLCLLCIPMVITANDDDADIQAPANNDYTSGLKMIAQAIRPEGPKTFGGKFLKLGQEAAWEGTKVVMVAAVMLIAESIRRKYIVDLVKNEDWDTHCKVEASGLKQYKFCMARIKELIEQQKNGLSTEQKSLLTQYQEDANKLEENLAKSRQLTIKRLPKELEHGGTMFNYAMYPLAKLLPS